MRRVPVCAVVMPDQSSGNCALSGNKHYLKVSTSSGAQCIDTQIGAIIMENEIRLFTAWSIVDFADISGVQVAWFCERTTPVGDYYQLVQDFHPGYGFQEVSLDERFTEDEIKMLQKYLRLVYGTELHVREEPLPMKGYYMPLSFIGVGYGCREGYCTLSNHWLYNLPFEVSGYFDLDNPMRADKVFVSHCGDDNGELNSATMEVI
jgi:hypothetical protein